MSEFEGRIGDLTVRMAREGFDWRWTVSDPDGVVRASNRNLDEHAAWCEALGTALKVSRAEGPRA